MSELGEVMRAAKAAREENQRAGLPESDNASMQVNQQANKSTLPPKVDDYANLAIRVSKRQRLHWLIEAKRQGTSLTAAITEALTARFGTASDD